MKTAQVASTKRVVGYGALMARWTLLVFLLVFAVGCTPAIPGPYLSQVDRSATYTAVRANASRYQGTIVAWGGYIHETRNTREGTYVEIVEAPLNHRDRPEEMDRTRGRFLLLHPGFAEPARYAPGREITVVGEFRGMEKRRLGEMDYRYPVLLRLYDRLWAPGRQPPFHIGIGVGAVFGD